MSVPPAVFRHWLFAAALVAAVFLAYQPAWQGGFIWDDDAHVTKPELRSLQGLYRIWFDVGATLQYYPLLHTAFWIEHRLWGENTLGYHLLNILLHATAALLAAIILRRLAVPGAYLAAAIFALHPVHVESVAWITEQKNTLSAVFYLSALLAYLRFDRTRGVEWYRVALGFFVLALLSKTVMGTLPGALLVIFWWQRGRLSWKNDVVPLVPFFLLGAGGGLITAWWELRINQCVGPEFALSPAERLLIAGRTIWFCLWKLCWPARLTFIYPRWQIDSSAWWQYLFPAGAAGLLAALWAIRRRTRAPLAALLFFGGTLFPVLGFFNLYTFLYSLVADHYQYLASLGMIALAAAGAGLLLERLGLWRRPGGYVLCLGLLAVLGGLTFRQCRMYADIETLYRTTIDNNPDCWMAYNNLGMYLNEHRRFEEADRYCRESLRLKSDNPQAHNNLGMSLAGRGRITEAIVHFRESMRMSPEAVMPHSNLGWALGTQGRIDEAIAQFQEALRLNPNYADAHRGLGIARVQKDKLLDALAGRRESLRSNPNDVALLNDMAWLLATDPNVSLRDGAEAVELARRAVQLSGGREPAILGTLAAAYAEMGHFPQAMQIARKALELAVQQNNRPLTVALRAQIALYEAGKPFRQMPAGDGTLNPK